MNARELETRMRTREELDKIILEYSQCFQEIDDYAEMFRLNTLQTKEQLVEAQGRLTGLYCSIITVWRMSEAVKTNMEAKVFIEVKNELETSGKKVTMVEIDKETNSRIGEWRLFRNLFEGYVLACDKIIYACKSILASTIKEGQYIFSDRTMS